MVLSKEELDEFKKSGYLVLRNFADTKECEAILDVAKAHLKHKIEPIETEVGYHTKSQEYRTKVADYNSIEDKEVVTVRRLRQVRFIIGIFYLKTGWKIRKYDLF